MLEVDEDSRLGREMLAHGTRYGAESVASEDEMAERYAAACEWLEADGVMQYEISNFARRGPCIAAQCEVLAEGAVCGIWAGRALDAAQRGGCGAVGEYG